MAFLPRAVSILALCLSVTGCTLLAVDEVVSGGGPDEQLHSFLRQDGGVWRHTRTVAQQIIGNDTIPTDTTHFSVASFTFTNQDGVSGSWRVGSKTLEGGGTESFEWGVEDRNVHLRVELWFPSFASPVRSEVYLTPMAASWGGDRFDPWHQPQGSDPLEGERQAWVRQ